MSDLASLLVSPHLIDVVLVFTAMEAIFLVLWLRRRSVASSPGASPRRGGGNLSPLRVGFMLLPGICIMLAVRAALADAAWPWVPAALAAALVAHLLDLQERWRA